MNKTTVLYGLAVIFILTGSIWTLQGANILPGSFMTGRAEWFVGGIVTVIVGAGIAWYARNQQNSGTDQK